MTRRLASLALAAIMFAISACAHAGPFDGPQGKPLRVMFNTEVSAESVAVTMAVMELAQAQGFTTILLEFNTPGGSVDAGFLLGKAIEDSPLPVVCVVDGEAASMGAWLLQGCKVRFMTPRSRLLMHGPSFSGVSGSLNAADLAYLLNDLQSLTVAMNAQLCGRLNITREDCDARIAKQWWFAAPEALEVGAIDAIVPSVAAVMAQLRGDDVRGLGY